MRVAVADSQQFAIPRVPLRKSRAGLWSGVAAVLVASYLAVTVWLPYRQMQVSVAEIARFGGYVATHRPVTWQRRVVRSFGCDSGIFERVNRVDLANTPLTDADLVQLPALTTARTLSLAGTAISDGALQFLSNARELTTLNLRDTRITSDGLSQLVQLDRLTHLDLNGTAIDDSAMKHILALHSLHHLSLAKSRITPSGLREISRLPLQTLDIDANALTPESVAELQKVAIFYGLGLYSDRDGDRALTRLSDLPGITHLHLVGGGFTDAGIPQLEALYGAEEILLEGTAISAAGIERLQRSLPECVVEQVAR